jgi:phage replication initiation protein
MQNSDSENPRIRNTGVQNTELSLNTNITEIKVTDYSSSGDLKGLIDWCEFTIPIQYDLDKVFNILGIPQEHNFTQLDPERKILGYSLNFSCGHIMVMSEGTAQMGHHVKMSGQGCREWELYRGQAWKDLFFEVISHEGKFSRLDIAVDDFHGYFKIPDLVDKIKNQELASRFKRAKRIEDILITNGQVLGTTLYFGRGSSDIQIRMYEKNHEQGLAEEIPIWNRTEIQMRNERALQFALIYADGAQEVGEYAQGVISNYLTFKDKDENDSNRSRWAVSPFWLAFLNGVDKIKLTVKKPDRTVARIENWLDSQVSKSMSMIALLMPERFMRMVVEGQEKFKEEDLILIDEYIKKKNLKDVEIDWCNGKRIEKKSPIEND